MKRKFQCIGLILIISILLSSCNHPSSKSSAVASDYFSDRDFEIGYDEDESIMITLNGDSVLCDSDAVQISQSTVTILNEGTYILSGTLNDGMIIVNSEKTDKIQLVLKNASIYSKTSAPIYILQSDKVFITTATDSVNTLSNGGTFTAIDENNIDAVIFSKEDLTMNGSGTLMINSPAGHGIVSKDSLKVTSGSYEINCVSHALSGKDDVCIANAEFLIDCGEDGIHAENDDDAGTAYVYIQSGTFEISSGDDAIHADGTLEIADGTIGITESYEGLEGQHVKVNGGNISIVASDDGINAAGGVDASGMGGKDKMRGHDQTSSFSGSITISGGSLDITASGDGIDANGSVEITGGSITVCGPRQGDTATLDFDTNAVITGGTFIGTGASGMAQSFTSSEQGVIAVKVGDRSAGTEIHNRR